MPSELKKSRAGRNWLRICIKNASFKIPLSLFYCSNSFCASPFLKIMLPALVGSTILQKDFTQIRSFFKNVAPKRPQKEHVLSSFLLLSLLWPFRSPFFRFLSPLEFSFSLVTCAHLAYRARSAKTTACFTPTFLYISKPLMPVLIKNASCRRDFSYV